MNLPPQLFVDWRDGFWVATNFGSATRTAPVPEGARIVIGGKELGPAGVTVWVASSR